MKKIISLLLLFGVIGLFNTISFGQAVIGLPVFSTQVTLTVNMFGTGSGTITTTDGKINCVVTNGSVSGTCFATYNIGDSVLLNSAPVSGNTFNWSNPTGSAACSGNGFCSFNITLVSTVQANFVAPGTNVVLPYNFGIDYNTSSTGCPASGGHFPTTILHGSGRFWDLNNVGGWVWMNGATVAQGGTDPTKFYWTGLDDMLCAMEANSVHVAQQVIGSRPPYFATANQAYKNNGCTTTASQCGGGTCHGFSATWQTDNPVPAYNEVPGQCYPTLDIDSVNNCSGAGTPASPRICNGNGDGGGTNQFERNWFAAYISHVNQPGYIAGTGSFAGKPHAHVQFYEIKNEPDDNAFYNGTYDDQDREQHDLYCIMKGGAQYVKGSVSSGQFFTAIVNTSGSTVTLVSGMQFTTGSSWNGKNFTINGTIYTVSSVTNSTTLIATTTIGSNSNAYMFENATQVSTLSVAKLMGAPNSSTELLNFQAAPTGSPDGTHTWGGSLTGSIYTPTASPTSMTIPETGETCAQVRSAVTGGNVYVNTTLFPNWPTFPLDTTASVIMGSYHGGTNAKAACDLYCSGSCNTSGNSCHHGVSLVTDILNWHYKPGQVNAGDPPWETTLSNWKSAANAILSSSDLQKPFFETEGAWSSCGWPNTSSGCATPWVVWNLNPMEAGYVLAFYTYSQSLGIDETVWYNWNFPRGGLGNSGSNTGANTGYSQSYNTLVGTTVNNGACTTSSPANPGTNFFQYSCAITLGNGNPGIIIWDNSLPCTGNAINTCPTNSVAVNNTFTTCIDALGNSNPIVSHHANVMIVAQECF